MPASLSPLLCRAGLPVGLGAAQSPAPAPPGQQDLGRAPQSRRRARGALDLLGCHLRPEGSACWLGPLQGCGCACADLRGGSERVLCVSVPSRPPAPSREHGPRAGWPVLPLRPHRRAPGRAFPALHLRVSCLGTFHLEDTEKTLETGPCSGSPFCQVLSGGLGARPASGLAALLGCPALAHACQGQSTADRCCCHGCWAPGVRSVCRPPQPCRPACCPLDGALSAGPTSGRAAPEDTSASAPEGGRVSSYLERLGEVPERGQGLCRGLDDRSPSS